MLVREAADDVEAAPTSATAQRRDLAAVAAMAAVMRLRRWNRVEPGHLLELTATALEAGDQAL